MMRHHVWILALALTGCPKSEQVKPDGEAPAPVAVADAAAAAPADAGATSPAQASASYSGKYSLAPAALYVPSAKDYSAVKQAKDEPSKLVGDGTLSFAIDGEGRVSGTIDSGPASPAIIDGTRVGSELRGNVRRKDPKDDGLTGTFSATVSGTGAEGMLNLADAHAALLREGKVSAQKK